MDCYNYDWYDACVCLYARAFERKSFDRKMSRNISYVFFILKKKYILEQFCPILVVFWLHILNKAHRVEGARDILLPLNLLNFLSYATQIKFRCPKKKYFYVENKYKLSVSFVLYAKTEAIKKISLFNHEQKQKKGNPVASVLHIIPSPTKRIMASFWSEI